jgi:hypothetical protein
MPPKAGTKNPASTPARGSEGGLQYCTARLFPHPVFGATVARSHDRDLMSMNKQVFWLRFHPTPPALPSLDSG